MLYSIVRKYLLLYSTGTVQHRSVPFRTFQHLSRARIGSVGLVSRIGPLSSLFVPGRFEQHWVNHPPHPQFSTVQVTVCVPCLYAVQCSAVLSCALLFWLAYLVPPPLCSCSCGSTCRSGFQSESGLHLSPGPNPFFRAIDGALTVRTQRSPYPLNSLGAIGSSFCLCASLFFILFPPFIPPYLPSGWTRHHIILSNSPLFHKAFGQPAATCSALH